MNLNKKKKLIARVMNVGIKRIILDSDRTKEIKEAITRQDIKELVREGVIKIKEKKGRKKVIKRRTKRGKGKFKRKVKSRKREYATLTRKLRRYLKNLKEKDKISKVDYYKIRGKIKARQFKSLDHFKEVLKITWKEEGLKVRLIIWQE